MRLEGNHAAEGDPRVSDLLEAADRCGIGGRDSSPGRRREARTAPSVPWTWPGSSAARSRVSLLTCQPRARLGMIGSMVGGGIEAEDDVVDRDSEVESALRHRSR